MVKYKEGDILEIYWIDTFGHPGWFTEEEVDEKTERPLELFTGYFIKDSKGFIIICMGLERDGDFAPYNNPKWIPKGFIKSIKRLKRTEIKMKKTKKTKKISKKEEGLTKKQKAKLPKTLQKAILKKKKNAKRKKTTKKK